MAVDNFELIKPYIKPIEEGDFYFLEILQRNKDGHKITGNNQERLVRDFCIISPEHLESHRKEIITLCEDCDARAYIRLNRKSYSQVMKYLGYKISKNLMNGNKFRNPYRETASAIGKTFAKDEVIKWIVDVDYTDAEKENPELARHKVDLVKSLVNQSKHNNDPRDLILGEIPTKNGMHIVTYKFDKENFNKICYSQFGTYGLEGVEIKGGMCSRNDNDERHDMDSPTLLYCPTKD